MAMDETVVLKPSISGRCCAMTAIYAQIVKHGRDAGTSATQKRSDCEKLYLGKVLIASCEVRSSTADQCKEPDD